MISASVDILKAAVGQYLVTRVPVLPAVTMMAKAAEIGRRIVDQSALSPAIIAALSRKYAA